MVELTLPKNSKITEGKTWKRPAGARNVTAFRVYRWTFARMVLYAGALLFAYQADPDGQAALLGAAGGLFIARVVMLAVGVAAWRRKQDRGIGDR